MKAIKFIPILIFILIFYKPFFSTISFVAHDWPLLFRESRIFFPFWSLAWDYMGNGGIGGPAFKTLWIDLYTNFVYFFSNTFNIPWWLSQRVFWIIPFLFLSITSSYKLSELVIKDKLFRFLSSIIYTFNTYILLIQAGGQFGIAFAYGAAPLVLYSLIRLFNKNDKRSLIGSSFLSGFIVALDPRIALLTFTIVFFWYLFFIRRFNLKSLVIIFLNFSIALLINAYWILPILTSVFNQSISNSVSSYSSLAGVKFLSFATLENAFSFLHPNWPENIFGKVYFQRPEFLILPILAFGSILFKVKKEILFFALIGLLGIFLAKGTNDPFGEIYLYLFQYFPGFTLFRDATKFYILIALSFSILIPYFLSTVSENFEKLKLVIAGSFIVLLLLILKPAWGGELTGIFNPKQIPEEYVRLNTDLKYSSQKNETEFSRVLWIPRRQKYGYFDPSVPAADSEVLFKGRDISGVTEQELYDFGIYYIIVPTDPDGEIFLKDRKYDEKVRKSTINKIEKIDFLERASVEPGIKVYHTYSSADLFWLPEIAGMERFFTVSWKFINPTEYELEIKNAKKGDMVIFSQGFDSGWIAKGDGFEVRSEAYEKKLNSFTLTRSGTYNLKVYYGPQRFVVFGLIISVLTILALVLIFFYFKFSEKYKKMIDSS